MKIEIIPRNKTELGAFIDLLRQQGCVALIVKTLNTEQALEFLSLLERADKGFYWSREVQLPTETRGLFKNSKVSYLKLRLDPDRRGYNITYGTGERVDRSYDMPNQVRTAAYLLRREKKLKPRI